MNSMRNGDKVAMFSEQYENEKTGEKIEGITILVDCSLKQMFDIIMAQEKNYENYTQVMRDILFSGVNSFIKKYQ